VGLGFPDERGQLGLGHTRLGQLLGVPLGRVPPVGLGIGCHSVVFGFEFDNGVDALGYYDALNNGLC
jgi:hypothetical protein